MFPTRSTKTIFYFRRGLTPPHRVKSISMATFTPEEIEFIKARGNDYCRRVWLGLYEGESVNFTDEQSVKDFMSDKYEKKRYYIEQAVGSATVNGGSTLKVKGKSKSGSVAQNATPLISIAPQNSKFVGNNNIAVNSVRASNHVAPTSRDVSHRLARPVTNMAQPLHLNNFSAAPTSVVAAPPSQPPVPE